MQTIHFIVGSKTQRTTPKDWELFDNVYNRPQKAAEVHQMLRQDGARRSPPSQNEVRYEITFLEAQSYKGGGATKILIYLLGLTKLDTQQRRWEEKHSLPTVKRSGKTKPWGTML